MSFVQRIEESNVRVVSRIVDSVSFSAPSGSGDDAVRGTINVSNQYKGLVQQPDGSMLHQLSLRVDVMPEEEGAKYYSFSVSVSGLFQAISKDLTVEDAEREVLTFGAQSLYSLVCDVASTLTRDGLMGELVLPMISFVEETG